MFGNIGTSAVRKLTPRHDRSGCAFPGAIAVLAALLFPAGTCAASPQAPPPYIGKWYVSVPEVCTGTPGETDGLLTYTASEFIGLENRCHVARATRRGDATELAMKCSGEGRPYNTREIVKVIAGRLHRTLKDERKWVTYTYERCPGLKP